MAAAFLANVLFWSGVSIGGVVLAALVEVTGGEWLGPMRDIAERFRRFLPISFVLFAVLMWRRADVYVWARTPADTVWLAPVFLVLRDAVVLAVVYGCAFAYCNASRRARTDGESVAGTGRMAVTFLIVYAIGFSVLAVDLIMSLKPHWTSTLFPAYVFTGNVYGGTAAVTTWSAWTGTSSGDLLSRSRVRDATNLLAGLALFWMYLFWSQFLVIWYGNLTAEVGFVMARVGTSRPVGWMILVMCWAAPVVMFVPQWGKRVGALRVVGVLVLIGCWLERWLLVAPDLPPASFVQALAVTALFAALFAASVALPSRPRATAVSRSSRERHVM
jgi:hypothetical protein